MIKHSIKKKSHYSIYKPMGFYLRGIINGENFASAIEGASFRDSLFWGTHFLILRYVFAFETNPFLNRIELHAQELRMLCGSPFKVSRQRLTSVMWRPKLKIPTVTKWLISPSICLISPSICVIIKICKKHHVLETNSNIHIYREI